MILALKKVAKVHDRAEKAGLSKTGHARILNTGHTLSNFVECGVIPTGRDVSHPIVFKASDVAADQEHALDKPRIISIPNRPAYVFLVFQIGWEPKSQENIMSRFTNILATAVLGLTLAVGTVGVSMAHGHGGGGFGGHASGGNFHHGFSGNGFSGRHFGGFRDGGFHNGFLRGHFGHDGFDFEPGYGLSFLSPFFGYDDDYDYGYAPYAYRHGWHHRPNYIFGRRL